MASMPMPKRPSPSPCWHIRPGARGRRTCPPRPVPDMRRCSAALRTNPFSALFGGSVCVVRGLGASSVTFCHYNRDILFQLPVAAGPATLPDDPSCVETWLSPELRLMTQDNNGISIRTDQWVKYDLSLHAFFWILGT